MNFKRHLSCIVGTLGLCAILSAADERKGVGDTLRVPADQITATLRLAPMPDLGEGHLAKILRRYYDDGLGGSSNWDQISSLKVIGNLKLAEGDFELKAYQKKPNLIKMTIRSNHRDLVLGYDGNVAWQKLPGREAKPEAMPELEARRFKHGAIFGNHLLYPFAEGKKIEYIDTVPTDGDICHQIRVTLDTGYQVDYFIDIRKYLEIKAIGVDLRGGTETRILYRDYTRVCGIPIAKQVESYEDGKWVSSLTLDEVKINAGVIPWMFKMSR
ncbi:hypothetical protein ACWPKO_05780 [Coraliomargarita sp. W4R53]